MHKPKFSRRTDKYTPRHVPVVKEGEALTTSAMIASLDAEGRAAVAALWTCPNDLVAQGHDIVGLSADLSKYTDTHIFANAHPDRFYQMGMAEALLMSAVAGLVREGFIPCHHLCRFWCRVAPMILSRWRLPKKTCPSKFAALCPSHQRAMVWPSGDRRRGNHARFAKYERD